MLFRQTLLYLPAQLLPALFQFAQLIAWSHLTTPEVIGVVTLFVSVQEMLNIALMAFWNQYTTRFSAKLSETEEDRLRLRSVSTAVVAVSLSLQIGLAIAIYALAIDRHVSLALGLTIAALVGGRALNLFQAERARAQGDIQGYSVAIMAGPVAGCVLGLLFLSYMGNEAFWVFLGFAMAQVAGAVFCVIRDPRWIGLGRPDLDLVRHAIAYGGPIIISSVMAWASQNAARIAVSYVFGFGAAGIYSLGMGLGYRASMVAAMLVTAAAFPIAVRLANAGDASGALRQLSANGALLIGVLASTMAGLAMVAPELLRLLMPGHIDGAVLPIMLWSLLAGVFICIRQHYFNQVFLLHGNTGPIARVAVIEALVAVVLAAGIVPLGGPLGGAIALALTSCISMVVTFFMAGKAGLIVPWRIMGRIAAATMAMVAALAAFPSSADVLHLAVRIGAGGLAFLAAAAVLFRGDLLAWRLRRQGGRGQ